MLDPSPPFYVVTVGRQYLRLTETLIVGAQLQHARQFETLEAAQKAKAYVIEALSGGSQRKKPVGIQRITIEDAAESQPFVFTLPIGDWSDDGHGKCEWFSVRSNKPLQEVREAHFKGRTEILDIEELCSEYEVYSMSADELPERAREFFDHPNPDGRIPGSPEGMVQLWIEILSRADPGLRLALISKEEAPMLPLYGQDEQGRHISHVGYGLFV